MVVMVMGLGRWVEDVELELNLPDHSPAVRRVLRDL